MIEDFSLRNQDFFIVLTNPHGEIIEANRFCEYLFGADPHGKNISDYVTCAGDWIQDCALVDLRLESHLCHITTEDEHVHEIYIDLFIDGDRLLWLGKEDLAGLYEQRKLLLKNQAEIFLDTHETIKKSYRDLERLEQRHHMILEAAGDGVFGLDADGNHTFVNPAAAEILGYTREELIGKHSHSTWHHHRLNGEEYPDEECPIYEVLQTGVVNKGKEFFIRSNGEFFIAEFIATPLIEEGKIVGAVVLFRDISVRIEQEELLRLQTKKFKALLELPRLAESLDEKEFIQRGQEMAEDLTGSVISFIHFVSDDEQDVELVTWSRRTLDNYCDADFNKHYPVEKAGIWADALRQREPVIFNNYDSYPYKCGLPKGHTHLERLISLPVIEHGKVVMLTGVGNKETDYNDMDVEIVQLLSNEIWRIVQRRRNDRKIRQAAEVFKSTDEGVTITDLQGVIIDVNDSFCKITGYLRHEVIGARHNLLQSGRHDESFYQSMWKSLTEVGQWRGEIWNRRKSGAIYPQLLTISAVRSQNQAAIGYVGVFSDISEIKQTEERLHHLAHHDPLTKLPNRLLLDSRLRQSIKHAKRKQTPLAVVFVDIDRFKFINDSLGHYAGDQLLAIVAERLSQVVRSDDTVARISGDEFVLILEEVGGADNTSYVIEKIFHSLTQVFEVDDHRVHITASVGIAMYPQDGVDALTLMQNADAAMYQAKRDGRNTFQFYSNEMSEAATEHVFLGNSMRDALDNNEFYLVYQPQMNLTRGSLLGVETLLRWNHPERGIVSPARFIPIAEQNGMIKDLGAWVLLKACEQGKKWLDEGFYFGRIAVNVSGSQLQDRIFVELVQSILKETGLPPENLELEVTESFVMRRVEDCITKLEELRRLGILVTIDDFGTGYSSLSYLKSLPVDKIKIDQSFVHDIPLSTDDMAIAQAIIAMAKALHLKVIAEGVETEEQAYFLIDKGCSEAQGYLFSRPVEADKVVAQMLSLNHSQKLN